MNYFAPYYIIQSIFKMKKISFILSVAFLVSISAIYGQDQERELGHTNTNKFKQLYDEFATPNMYRTASGAPGAAYYQQQADYKMDIELDDKAKKITCLLYTSPSPRDS